MQAHTLMVQGCTSDAGKTTLVAALCRIFARRGYRVAPFKPQNMALNSAVTAEGGEIGRAQALQAQAAGVAPHTDFNPVLLKPSSDRVAQVIVHGRVVSSLDARDYHAYKTVANQAVLASWQRLLPAYDLLFVEGAGSPAEINLRDRDIANMGFAEQVDCPVILVVDIDRGGVFAHLVGTLELLSDSERHRVAGFVINRFRGDIQLLIPGIEWLEKYTGKPVFGVLPYLHGLFLDAEDAVHGGQVLNPEQPGKVLRVVAPVYPRISNHNDLDPLRLHPEVNFQWIGPGQPIPPADLVVLPGSKSVRADMEWLRQQGWAAYLQQHLRYGGKVLGLCGGYQMLGERIEDPEGLEGHAGSSPGLGFLACSTRLAPEKALLNIEGHLALPGSPRVRGYEIHQGVTEGPALGAPLLTLGDGRIEGVMTPDGQIMASYCHGLLETPEALAAILAWAGLMDAAPLDPGARREADLNRLADAVETALDWSRLESCFPWLAGRGE